MFLLRKPKPGRSGGSQATSAGDIDTSTSLIRDNEDDLQRQLDNRHIQMLVIGGSIGAALFVSIGRGLAAGGPGNLFLAYVIYSCIVALINNCAAELTIYMPISGGFIRLAGAWVDEAFGFMAGWNFFLYESLLIPFEITALCEVLTFWRSDIPQVAVIVVAIVLYRSVAVQSSRRSSTRSLTYRQHSQYPDSQSVWRGGSKQCLRIFDLNWAADTSCSSGSVLARFF